jgi:hypothetical protein
MLMIQALLLIVGVYLGVGLVFAAAFVTVGVSRVDHVAAKTSIGFRLLIVPGSAALWPVLLVKWQRAARRRAEP